MKTPIVDAKTESLELHIEGLGSEAVRVLHWTSRSITQQLSSVACLAKQ